MASGPWLEWYRAARIDKYCCGPYKTLFEGRISQGDEALSCPIVDLAGGEAPGTPRVIQKMLGFTSMKL